MADHTFKDNNILHAYLFNQDGSSYKEIYNPEGYYKTPRGHYLLVIKIREELTELYKCIKGIEEVEHSEWQYIPMKAFPDFIKTFVLLST